MSTENKIVLLIEDEPSIAELIEQFFAITRKQHPLMKDIEVCHQNRLEKALKHLAENKVDVILLDLNLPDSCGVSTFETIRDAVPEVPIIVLTGVDDEVIMSEILAAGAKNFLKKGNINFNLIGQTILSILKPEEC